MKSEMQTALRHAVSRRALLKSAAAVTAVRTMTAQQTTTSTTLVYIGTYTPNGEGIHLFQMDPTTGFLTQKKVFPSSSPSSIAIAPNGRFLYAVNEISNFMGGTTGSVRSEEHTSELQSR